MLPDSIIALIIQDREQQRFREHGDGPSDSIKDRELLDQLRHQLIVFQQKPQKQLNPLQTDATTKRRGWKILARLHTIQKTRTLFFEVQSANKVSQRLDQNSLLLPATVGANLQATVHFIT